MTSGLLMNVVDLVFEKSQCLRLMMILWTKVSLLRLFRADIGPQETNHNRANSANEETLRVYDA